jgi:sulfite exporter TauE/SafE
MTHHLFYVTGTHCPACKMLIEDVLMERDNVQSAAVDLRRGQLQVISTTADHAMEEWSALLQPYGYRLSVEKPATSQHHAQRIYAIMVGVGLLGLFFGAQEADIFSFDITPPLTAKTALIVGGVASFSSCLAVVGGLVLSLSAQVAHDARTLRPLVFFHLGRLLGFFMLGGVLGRVGQAISINFTVTSILGIITSIAMLLLGFNLLGVFKPMHYFAMPRRAFDRVIRMETGAAAPCMVGVATFFLPCGFTQSMQVAALASGSMISGSLIMGLFAVGTLPVLGLLSFGSFRFAHSRYAAMFLAIVGVVVIGFGLFALLTGLAALGIIPPILTL